MSPSSAAPLSPSGGDPSLGLHILESITDGFYAFDDQWRLTYLNGAARRILGQHLADPGSLLGRNFFVSFPDTKGTIIEESFRRAVDEGVVVEYDTFYAPWQQWFNSRCYPAQGGGLVVFFRDITDQVETQAALRASEAKYRLLFESIDEGFCVLEMIWDAAGRPVDYRFVDVNTAFSDQAGLHDVQGRTAREIIPTLETYWYEIYGEIARTGEARRFTQGSEVLGRVFDVYAFRIGTPEQSQVALIFQDITERRRTEAALKIALQQKEAAAKAKDEFLATLSHELRTPLNAILGWTQVLRGSPANNADVEDGLATIERNARAQAQIIEDLLDMSRIISGKVRLEVQAINLPKVLEAAVETVRPTAAAKGIRLQTLIDPDARMVSGDPNRLQQVFWNLLTNAIKFTPKNGRVQVLLERVNSHLEVSISDSGEGISPEFLPYVFDRFQQADASITRRHGGLGLGLAIVEQLVELHGGSVWASSPGPGQGASFRVDLPLKVAALPEDASEHERRHPAVGMDLSVPQTDLPSLDGLKVLVVDDEADARRLLKRLLRDRRAEVRTAGSAAEAFDLLVAEAPDVLVSDIGLPHEDGYSLIRRVRALGSERGGQTPAVALTAYARSDDRLKALLAGFQMHVAKPVNTMELLAVVASLGGRTGKAGLIGEASEQV